MSTDEIATATPASTLIIDWAGTVTVGLLDMIMASAAELGIAEDNLDAALHGLSGYLTDPDSILHRAERGEIDDDELRDHLDEIVPGAGGLFEPDPPSIFWAADRPEVMALLEELTELDVLVILATNNYASAQNALATRYLETGLVGAVVNSALVGMRKPDPAYFRLILDTFDLDPSEVVVFDDNEHNLEVARDLGMAGVHMGSDAHGAVAALRTELRR